MSRQTICLLNDSFPPMIDGVANTVVNYAKNIEAHHGHAVVVTPSVKGADDGGYPFPILRYPSIDTRKLLGYVAGYPFSPEILRRLDDEHTALLHTHCPVTSAVLARELRSVLNAPLVLTYHTKFDVDIAKLIKGRLLQNGAVKALVQNVAACDEVWVVSEGAGANLRALGYTGEYRVMPNGVDLARGRASITATAAISADWDLPHDAPMYLFLGRMMWYKGLRIILDGLKRLADAGRDFCMVFVGDGQDRAEVETYAAELGLAERCRFVGAVHDRETVRAWYTRADLLLFPSTFDTNGLVVREAAACGLASLLVRESCAAEGITDGRNGILIEENAESLAAALSTPGLTRDALAAVGQHAMDEIYLSWADSVANARARYEIVRENWDRADHTSGDSPMHTYVTLRGEVRENVSAAKSAVTHVQDAAHARRAEALRQIQTALTKAQDRIDRYL